MNKLFYLPYESNKNEYVGKTKSLIGESVDNRLAICSFPKKKELLNKPFRFFVFFFTKKADVLVLNWHENILRSDSGRLSAFGFFKFFLYFFLYKFSSRHIIYVRHNIYPHGMRGIAAKAACKLASLLEKWCDAKVTHSGHLESQGYTYIPHPLYELARDPAAIRICKTKDDERYSIIFGRISRYKKIELVVRAWNSKTTLLVAGINDDEVYLNELKSLAIGKSIVFDARFIEEDEAQNLVANADALILAHADEDIIVSGSFFYSISLGTPVYAIEKPFFKWLKETQEFEGLRLYKSAEALVGDFGDNIVATLSLRKRIRKQAEVLFGDSVVRKAWGDLIRGILS